MCPGMLSTRDTLLVGDSAWVTWLRTLQGLPKSERGIGRLVAVYPRHQSFLLWWRQEEWRGSRPLAYDLCPVGCETHGSSSSSPHHKGNPRNRGVPPHPPVGVPQAIQHNLRRMFGYP